MNRLFLAASFVTATGLTACALPTDSGGHNAHRHAVSASAIASAERSHDHRAASDARQLVTYPDAMRILTLANMRDHLLALGEIQTALAEGSFDKASDLAEQRLGMSSLNRHDAHHVAEFMPRGMRDAGTAMHRTASQFALVAKDASVSGDLKAVLASLGKLNQTCVACHAAYRLQ